MGGGTDLAQNSKQKAAETERERERDTHTHTEGGRRGGEEEGRRVGSQPVDMQGKEKKGDITNRF
eukprot:COSAG05_NODE_215_length_13904_cov_87.085911_5_plen_65_part_00